MLDAAGLGAVRFLTGDVARLNFAAVRRPAMRQRCDESAIDSQGPREVHRGGPFR